MKWWLRRRLFLDRPWCAFPALSLVLGRPVPADHLDLGMLCQPLGHDERLAIGEEVNRSARLEVRDDGSIPQALLEGEVVGTDGSRSLSGRSERAFLFGQQPIATRAQDEVFEKTTDGGAGAHIGGHQTGKSFAEDACGTAVSTTEPPNPQLDANRQSAPGQVLRPPFIGAVKASREGRTSGAGLLRRTARQMEADHVSLHPTLLHHNVEFCGK